MQHRYELHSPLLIGRRTDRREHQVGDTGGAWTVSGHITTVRGLGPALLMSAERGSQCHLRIRAAGQSLLDRAQQEGSVPADVDISDLLKLLNGISLASDEDTAQADRLVDLVIRGVAPGAG